MSDDDDEINDEYTFDVTNAKVQAWCSKDRTVFTLRLSDTGGMCDMKAYLLLRQKLHQMELDLGFHNEADDLAGPH